MAELNEHSVHTYETTILLLLRYDIVDNPSWHIIITVGMHRRVPSPRGTRD